MEMVQFHPTGLLAGADTRMTGTVLEEGLRGAGGYLLNGAGERFMQAVDPRGERATRDIVRSEEHTSELQSLMSISYAVFCLKKKTHTTSNEQKVKKRQ